MKTCIVIPTFNNSLLTLQCLDSLLKYTSDSVSIIIIDDHSTDEEFAKLMNGLPPIDGFRRIDVCRSSANVGFANICNEGSQLVRTDVIIFLNNDTLVTEHWYSKLISKININRICGSKLLYPENKYSTIHNKQIQKGTIQHVGIIVDDKNLPQHIYRFERDDLPEANIYKTYPYITGAVLAIYKEVFEDLGGFNNKYINGCEDLDLCLRSRKKGIEIIYCPESVAFHHETATRNPEITNLALFMQEYKHELEKDRYFESKELT